MMALLGLQSLSWYGYGGITEKKKRHLMHILGATERDNSSSSSSSSSSSQRFEIDRDKAREALKQLDQQIESQADKKPRPVVKTSSSSDVVRDSSNAPIMFEEPPEISGSFLAASAFLLLAFTLFYNILFITAIKPSVDGPESVPEQNRAPMSDSEIVQFPLSSFPEKTIKQ